MHVLNKNQQPIINDQILQQRLRNDDKKALEEVYLLYKDAFLNYALRYDLDKTTLLDIYQDAVIAMHQNFVVKQIILKESSIKTYLFGIGKYKIYDTLKAQKKVYALTKEVEDEIIALEIEEETLSVEQELLTKYFKQLGNSCQEILKLFYYRSLSVKEIVNITHYKDENTVKSHKSRCLKKLTSLITPNNEKR